jgi:hypothetical protein
MAKMKAMAWPEPRLAVAMMISHRDVTAKIVHDCMVYATPSGAMQYLAWVAEMSPPSQNRCPLDLSVSDSNDTREAQSYS